MADEVKKLQDLSHRMARLVENLRKKGEANITASVVESRQELLEELWQRYEHTYQKLLTAANADAKLQALPYFKEDEFDTVEGIYLDQKSALKDMWKKLTTIAPTVEISKSDETKDNGEGRKRAVLPKIQLPSFSGRYADWLSFRDMFSSLITRDPSLNAVEKLHYLKSCLRGEAAMLLRNIATTEKNFERAWTLLENRYENHRVLVRDQLATLWKMPAVIKESSQELRALVYGTVDAVEALAEIGRPVASSDDWLVFLTVEKLDRQTRREWENEIGDTTNLPSFATLQKFLEKRITTIEALEQRRVEEPADKKRMTGSGPKVHQVSKASTSKSCPLCQGGHYLLYCARYQSKAAAERKDLVHSLQLCSNCLGQHKLSSCTNVKRCQRCGDRHHTSLHEALDSSDGRAVHHASLESRRTVSVLLSTARVRVVGPGGRLEIVRALIDSGSEVSLVAESLMQRMGLHRRGARIPLLGVGGAHSRTARGRTTLVLTPCSAPEPRHQIDALILAKLSCYRPPHLPETSRWPQFSELTLADPHYRETDPVEVLLGADVYNRILRHGVIPGDNDRPAAQETDFGWILTGAVTMDARETNARVHHCAVDRELVSLLSKFWEQEEMQGSIPLPENDQACEDHFVSTHRRACDGRFIVRLPFKETPQLGESRSRALPVLQGLHRRFNRDETLRSAYQQFMAEYEQLGHMSRLRTPAGESAYFLPHHGVCKESSTTTKLRVVFNGSMPTTTGKSLNDYLHTGPNLLPPLFDVLLRWRRHTVAFTADVEKMFRQIVIHPDDRCWQQILWSCKNEAPIRTFQLNTLTYGLACAPYLATRCIKQLAADEERRFPKGAAVLLKDVYMDDVLSGASTVEEALELQQELHDLLTAGGFFLRKWASNAQELVEGSAERDPTKTIALDADRHHGVLGLRWLPYSDCFQVTVDSSSSSSTTRRSVLSKTAQLFDPLGWLAPVTVGAKILIQSLWLLKGDWDTPLPPKEEGQWRRFTRELPTLTSLRIPRWLGVPTPAATVELHGFADASQLAYAAVVYVRSVTAEGEGRVTLAAAKTKVAPLKKITLPRLELSAACLLARLTHKMLEVLEWRDVEVHLWTDSLVTLSWIKGHPAQWRTYVANRVAEIQRLLPEARWHHVRGVENPADCASRGLSPAELPEFKLWWQGPSWLAPQGSWPHADPCWNEDTQEERVLSHHVQTSPTPAITAHCASFSNFQRLCRVTAWCCRWLRTSRGRRSIHLTSEETLAARTRLVRAVQQQAFPAEIAGLRQGKGLPAKSRLTKLSPFIDGPGVLRLGGRLQRAALPYERMHPLILPDESPLARLWVEDAHHRSMHGGVQLTLATLRQDCWVLRGRTMVKACINRCHRCVRWRGRALEQLMGSLPAARVSPSRPFWKTGVDYAGPILVRASRGRGQKCEKGYIALFICLATRAVHLEVVSDGTTAAFLAALKRFTSRRGTCAEIFSDCGTVFVGADRELRSLICTFDSSNRGLFDAITMQGIQWRFNPPSAPHFGGLWEAAVKSVKHHLRRQVGEQRLTYEELATLLAGIEACLNSRPLQPLTDDPEDPEALTPGHFLIGGPITALPELGLEDVVVSRLSRWQLLQQLQQHFWRRWSNEYLNTLQTRGKWHKPLRTVEVGDLCLVKNELLPPSRWPLARVVATHPGNDGLTRVATLKTASTQLTRPINKIVRLPRDDDDVSTTDASNLQKRT